MQSNAAVQKTSKTKPVNEVHLASLRANGKLSNKHYKKAKQAKKAARAAKRGHHG